MTNREISALVSEKVMGNARCKNCTSGKCDTCCSYHKDYSTCIKAAWEVVEVLSKTYMVDIQACNAHSEFYQVQLDRYDGKRWVEEVGGVGQSIEGDSVTLAICKAALLTKGIDIDDSDK